MVRAAEGMGPRSTTPTRMDALAVRRDLPALALECIFGNGCQGVLRRRLRLVLGCCSYGAHFSDAEARDAVARSPGRSTPTTGSSTRSAATGASPRSGRRDGRPWPTRIVKEACIFLNRPDFPTGPGCALDQRPIRIGVHLSDTKPEVCWQLPLRRVDKEQDDGRTSPRSPSSVAAGWAVAARTRVVVHGSAGGIHRGRSRVSHPRAELQKIRQDAVPAVVSYLGERLAAPGVAPVVHPAEVPVKITSKTASPASGPGEKFAER